MTITIRFNPTEAATAYADLYITTNAAANPELHITLNGEGVKAQASVADESTMRSGITIATSANPLPLSGRLQVGIGMPGRTNIALYDLLGVERAVIFDGMSEAGNQSYAIDTRSLPSGIYFCVVRTSERSATKQITIAK